MFTPGSNLKSLAFAPLLFSRTGLSNLLNKIQFTFEVVPCLMLGLFKGYASILDQRYKGIARWVEVEREEDKPLCEDTKS